MIDSFVSHINNKMSENNKSETNPNKAHTDSKVGQNGGSKNNRSETVVPEDMVEKGSVDEVSTDREDRIDENEVSTDREDRIDENEVVAVSTENDTQDHLGSISKYAPSLDLPIALRKGNKPRTKHSFSNYVFLQEALTLV